MSPLHYFFTGPIWPVIVAIALAIGFIKGVYLKQQVMARKRRYRQS